MNNDLREQIYKNLNLKDADELLEIWTTNDRVEWSDTTFDVIEELLRERIGQVPKQNEPVLEHKAESEGERFEDWETKLLDEENQPVFYDTLEVLSLRDNINNVAKMAVIVYAFIGILNIPWISLLFEGIIPTLSEIKQFGLQFVVTILTLGIRVATIYFPLIALTHILRILMEMEFRSRKGIKSNSVVE